MTYEPFDQIGDEQELSPFTRFMIHCAVKFRHVPIKVSKDVWDKYVAHMKTRLTLDSMDEKTRTVFEQSIIPELSDDGLYITKLGNVQTAFYNAITEQGTDIFRETVYHTMHTSRIDNLKVALDRLTTVVWEDKNDQKSQKLIDDAKKALAEQLYNPIHHPINFSPGKQSALLSAQAFVDVAKGIKNEVSSPGPTGKRY